MKVQIVRVSPLQTAKVFAAMYFVMSIPLVLLASVPAMMMGGRAPGLSLVTLIMMPLLYVVVGFLFTLLGAWIYNLVASRIGGTEFTMVDVAAE